jgi:transposase
MLEMAHAFTADDRHTFRTMKEQGMSISEIARRTGVSRKTVRKYIAMEKPVKYSREGRQSVCTGSDQSRVWKLRDTRGSGYMTI